MEARTTTTIDGTQQGAAAIAGADRWVAPPPSPTLAADDPHAWFRRGWKLRCALTLIAIVFLALFVIVPAVNVFAQALKHGWGAYVDVFYPSVNQARIDEIQEKLKSPSKTPLLERRKLSKELSELQAPLDRAKKNWSAIRMTLGVAAIVLPMNRVFGVAAAWAVTKFRFKGRSFLVSLIDLPFSVSPVISGLVFVLIFGAQGFLAAWSRSDRALWLVPVVWAIPWILLGIVVVWAWRRLLQLVNPGFRGVYSRRAKWVGFGVVVMAVLVWKYVTVTNRSWAFLLPTEWSWPVPTSLYWRGFSSAHWWPIGAGEFLQGVIFTPLAIVLASIFVTFPFVARSLVPLMEAQGVEAEQAAISLGAGGWYTFRRVTLPSIKWGLLYGVILCSARAFGEFGAVSVVSGHLDSNDTMPLRVEKLWQEYKTQAAFTVASLLAMLAVVTLVLKTIIEWKTREEVQAEESGPKSVLGGVRH
jgi:ABC-type sulfate transport system permease subunit